MPYDFNSSNLSFNKDQHQNFSDNNLGALIKADLRKLYYLMVLTGVPTAHAIQYLFNLRYSNSRASMIQIRNMFLRSLKQLLLKVVDDPILYQRARILAQRKEFNVFEEVRIELNKTLDESVIDDILKKLEYLSKNEDYQKEHRRKLKLEVANRIATCFNEELQGTGGTQLGTPQISQGTSGGGIDSFDPLLGVPAITAKRKKGNKTMIQRRGTMVGNPHFTLNAEGFTTSVNGSLPEEINEALNETGIVVLENSETEQMMFLVKEDTKEEN